MNFNRVSGNYFETLGVPLVSGRTFGATDVLQAPAGKPIERIQIVGVVRNSKYKDIREDFPPIVHLAASQATEYFDSASSIVALRPGIASVAPALARRWRRSIPRSACSQG